MFDMLLWACLRPYICRVMQSVAQIGTHYVNVMQMLLRMLKVIQYQYAFALDE